MDVYICKYYSVMNGKKNGKACMIDPDNPRRCMPFYYETECKDYIKEDLNEILNKIDD